MNSRNVTLPVRDRILSIAEELILSRGFSSMSVETICSQAAITKGGFFHHFRNKESLGEAVLEKFWSDAVARIQQVQQSQYASHLDFVRAYLDHAIHCYQDPKISRGCMLAIFTMGLADTNPALYELTQQCLENWRADLVAMFEALKQEQQPMDFDPQAWSELYIATLEGALVLAKARSDTTVVARTLGMFKQHLMQAVSAH